MPSGIYIARLVTPEYTKSIKMVLLKQGRGRNSPQNRDKLLSFSR